MYGKWSVVQQKEIVVVSASFKAGFLFLNSSDPAVRALADDTRLERRLQALAKAVATCNRGH